MRWFVEVSSIGDSAAPGRLCVEARQWQTALEQARVLLSDAVPLSRFSIEVLDDGYRAVNVERRTRYVVRRAPDDAELTDSASLRPSTIPPPLDSRGVTTLPAPATVAPNLPSVTVPSDAVPPAPPAPSQKPASTRSGSTAPIPARSSAPDADARAEVSPVEASRLLRRRVEEPNSGSPIVYLEAAFVVEPELTRAAVERVLLQRFRELCSELEQRPSGKYVQLAIFDHEFEQRPLRAPLATLSWKDWRGAPSIGFPAFGEPSSPLSPSLAPRVLEWEAREARSTPAGSEPPSLPPSVPPPSSDSAPLAPAPVVPKAEPLPEIAEAPPVAAPEPAAAPRKRSRPRSDAPLRTRASEDLLAEVFEQVHDLHFSRDIAAGSDFVLELLRAALPSQAIVIHVFDIDSGNFVVVRSHPPVNEVLLWRTPDDDPFVRDVMARARCARYEDVSDDARFESKLWSLLGVTPAQVMMGPVKHGGRYLGMIQLVNPKGGGRFRDSEANALDYICEQFADFIAEKPVVLEADTVVPPA